MNQPFRLLATGAVCILVLTFLAQWTTSQLAKFLHWRRSYSDWTRYMTKTSASRVIGEYEAPLYCDPSRRVPNEYTVFLRHGYTLEQHKQAVGGGVDLDSAIKSIVPPKAWHGLSYFAELSDANLAAVRADIGADMVECNMWFDLFD